MLVIVVGIIVFKKCGERNQQKAEKNDMYKFEEEDGTVGRLGALSGIGKSPQPLYMDPGEYMKPGQYSESVKYMDPGEYIQPGQYVESSKGKDKDNVSKIVPNNGFSIKQRISAIAVAVLPVLCCVPVITMCKKCTERTQKKYETSEMNDMYGQYEFDEGDGTVVRLGSVWGIDKSPQYGQTEQPQYGETEQAQVSRQLSQVQVKDINEDYAGV